MRRYDSSIAERAITYCEDGVETSSDVNPTRPLVIRTLGREQSISSKHTIDSARKDQALNCITMHSSISPHSGLRKEIKRQSAGKNVAFDTASLATPRASRKTDPRAKRKMKPVKLDPEFGAWEKKTKGFGMKMLMKMGFKGRLGKYEQGTTVPIAVKKRRLNAGLGADGREAVNLKQNREFEKDFYNKSSDDEVELDEEGVNVYEQINPRGANVDDNEAIAQRFRRRRVDDGSIAQLVNGIERASEDGLERSHVILDFRGPSVRTLDSMKDISLSSRERGTLSSQRGSTTGGTDVTEDAVLTAVDDDVGDIIESMSRKLSALENRMYNVDAEIKRLEDEEAFDRSSSLSESIVREVSRISSEAHRMTSADLCEALIKLRREHGVVWSMYSLAALANEYAPGRLRVELDSWNPIAQGATTIVEHLSPWKSLLASGPEDAESSIDRDVYAGIVKSVCLDSMRRSIVNDWDVRDPDPCVYLFMGLQTIAPSAVIKALLIELVLPKLRLAVQSWSPRRDSSDLRVDKWIHPWLHPRLLGHEGLSSMWPTLRRRIDTALKTCDSARLSMHSILSPWTSIFSQRHVSDMVKRRVIPKLASSFRSIVIDERSTSCKPLESALMWYGVMSGTQLVMLLEGEFFSKWLYALSSWLRRLGHASSSNVSLIEAWYRDWKGQFGSKLSCEVRLNFPFHVALCMIAAFARDDIGRVKSIAEAIPSPDVISYDMLNKQERSRFVFQRESSVRHAAATRKNERWARSEPNLTFRDVVEVFASRNGISFLPSTKRGHVDGKQVYLFGSVYVYLDRNVVFAQREKKHWDPIDLSVLLSVVKGDQEVQS